MENWGLLTFRDRALLAPAASASVSDKEYVAYVTCHEIAHQWFGDLITPATWQHLWLKEVFDDRHIAMSLHGERMSPLFVFVFVRDLQRILDLPERQQRSRRGM